MVSTIAENIVIYDWLSFTSKKHSPEQIIDALGLSHVPWVESKGARGYKSKKYFSSINIHYDGRDDMGVWCEMTGQGCRTFETLSKHFTYGNGWDDMFSWIHENGCKLTRLDVAYDDHTGVLPIGQIVDDTQCGMWISKSDYWEVVMSSVGTSVFIGAPSSKVRIRIYDKAAERHIPDTHWIRCELQLRDDRAQCFTELTQLIGEAFAGVILNYLRYIEPSEDVNKWRWPMTDYWRCFRPGCGEDQHIPCPGDGVQPGSLQTLCGGTGRERDCSIDRAVRPGRAGDDGSEPAGKAKSQIRHDDQAGAGTPEDLPIRRACGSDPEESGDWDDTDREIRRPGISYYVVRWRLHDTSNVYESNTGSARSAELLLELLSHDSRVYGAHVDAVPETDWPF